MADRYVFLFDTLIVLTKQNIKRSSVTAPTGEYKFKEKIQTRRIDVLDREDHEGMQTMTCRGPLLKSFYYYFVVKQYIWEGGCGSRSIYLSLLITDIPRLSRKHFFKIF